MEWVYRYRLSRISVLRLTASLYRSTGASNGIPRLGEDVSPGVQGVTALTILGVTHIKFS